MKKKFFGSLIALLVVIGMMPVVIGAGGTVGGVVPGEVIVVPPENSVPQIWMDPASRVIYNAAGNSVIATRNSDYAFSGEQIEWDVIVYDADGIDDISQVHIVIGDLDNEDERIAYCQPSSRTDDPIEPIDGMMLPWDPLTMGWYTCTFEVAGDMGPGEYGIVAEVEDNSGATSQFDEDESFYLNPVIRIGIVNDPISFIDVSPGERVYSNTILVRNLADYDTGVILDLAISGSNLYDPSDNGLKAQCPINNALELSNFAYYATSGGWDTYMSGQTTDPEGYDTIPLEGVDARQRVIKTPSWPGLVIGQEIVITFRLDVPDPCEGEFVVGGDPLFPDTFIYFWAEAK